MSHAWDSILCSGVGVVEVVPRPLPTGKKENDETALLEALAGLLRNFSNAKQHSGQKQESQQFAQPTPKTKSNAKGKGNQRSTCC